MNIFVYSHPEEYLTRIILDQVEPLRNWRSISSEQFVKEVQFQEFLTQDKFDSTWDLNGKDILSSTSDVFLDRVFTFQKAEKMFADPHFAELEMAALFYHLRNNSKKHQSTLMHLTPNSWNLDLTSQWAFARSLGLSVPRFELPYQGSRSALNPQNLVITEFTDKLNWKPGCYSKSERALAFERPVGKVLSILATPNSFLSADGVVSDPAGEIAIKICQALNVWFVEVILFQDELDESKFVFGMVSTQPSKKFSDLQLSQFIRKEISNDHRIYTQKIS
jgi:hypothetical protein